MLEPITKDEAKAQGKKKYYQPGQVCKKGHDGERYVANGACVICVNDGRRPPKTVVDHLVRQIKRNPTVVQALSQPLNQPAPAPAAPAPLVAQPPTPPFEWTDAKRAQLIEKYVDTGNIGEARDAIAVTPSAYHRELESNPAFADAIAKATPLAKKHLLERAQQLALKGNATLLQTVLKAEFPEYRDSLKLDVNQTVKTINDSEIDRKIERLIGRGRVIDARLVQAQPLREIGIAAPDGGETTESSAQ